MKDCDNRGQIVGKVYLVGAGPGDPELLTLRALRVIQRADVVLHDALVSPQVLALAPSGARLENVGKRCGHRELPQEEIHRRMIQFVRERLTVVRLQGGDPLFFGRTGEEISALAEAGVEYEIVPGVTAASAAAAAAGFALTDRRVAAQVFLLTGHRAGDRQPRIPEPPKGGSTVAVYMPAADYSEIAKRFRAVGWAGNTACVVVSGVSTPREIIVSATLDTLGDCERLPTPAILIVGDATKQAASITMDEEPTCGMGMGLGAVV